MELSITLARTLRRLNSVTPYLTIAYFAYQVGTLILDGYSRQQPESSDREYIVRPRSRGRNPSGQISSSTSTAQIHSINDSGIETQGNSSDEPIIIEEVSPDEDEAPPLYSDHETVEVQSDSTEFDTTWIDSDTGIEHNDTMCYVCLEPLACPGRPVASLPFCFHRLHKNCIDGLLRITSECPICKTHIFTPV